MTTAYDKLLRELGDFTEHVGPDSPSAPDAFASYRGPGGRERFAREVLRLPGLLRWQLDGFAALESRQLLAIASANACGKSAWNFIVALYDAVVLQKVVLYASAGARQVKTSGSRELKKILSRARGVSGRIYNYGFVPDVGDGRIFFLSGDAISSLQGYHHTQGVTQLIDEGQSDEDGVIIEAGFANAAGGHSQLVIAGNPLQFIGAFHALFRRGDDHWWKRQISALDVIDDPEYARIPGLVKKSWVAMMAGQYGRESSVFGSRVLGNFPKTAVDAHFSEASIAAAFERWSDPQFIAREQNRRRTLGVDVAASEAGDECCCAVAHGNWIKEFITWREPDTMRTVGKVLAILGDLRVPMLRVAGPSYGDPLQYLGKPTLIIIDEIGVGKGAADRIKEKGFACQAFNASRRSDVGDPITGPRYQNLRAEAYDRLRTLMSRGLVAFPRDALLEEELLTCRSFTNSSGRLQIIEKSDWRAVIGRSPDRLDSLVMALCNSAVPTFGGDEVSARSGLLAGI